METKEMDMVKLLQLNKDFSPGPEKKKYSTLLLVIKIVCLMAVLTFGFLIYDQLAINSFIHKEETYAAEAQELRDKMFSELYHEKAELLLYETKPIPASNLKIACYYILPTGNSSLQPEQLDANLCTHVIILNAKVINGTLQPGSPGDIQIYKRVLKLKEKNPKLKVLLCVGSGSSKEELPGIVDSDEKRKAFVLQSTSFLIEHSFDGLDVDWEFPSITEKKGFTKLLKDLRNAFSHSQNPSLLLTAAVGAPLTIIDTSYEIPQMALYVDWINLMCYDYHFFTLLYPLTGANAPLFPRKTEFGYFHTLNIEFSANCWVQKGMPKSKILVGVPTYGHSFRLLTSLLHGFSAPAIGFGSVGDGGFVNLVEVCEFLGTGTVQVFNEESRVPYAYKDRDWISYEDDRSAKFKGDWIRRNNFAGMMIFDFNSDDHLAKCPGSTAPYPIMRALISALKGN